MKKNNGGGKKTARVGRAEIGGTTERPPLRIATVRKLEADAVIAEARKELEQIDPADFDEEIATAVAAAIRVVGGKVSDLTRAERKSLRDRLGALLETIVRSLSADSHHQFLKECRALDLEPSTVFKGVVRVAVLLSNIIRATTGPWHNKVPRRFGIVCRADGLPIVTPRLLDGEVLGVYLDELEYRAIPTASYSLVDHAGDLYEVLGPAADAEVGKVSIDLLRAWRRVSLAKLNREMELLPEPSERIHGGRFGPDWPPLTRLPGLSNPGVRGADKDVKIVVYLTAEKFGVAPPNPLDDDEQDRPEQETNDVPRLPEGLRAGSGELVLRAPRQPKSGGKS
ncbi:MAG: hypothetical protein WC538_03855 [Thermoanaerobaculia bacterium]|jgi:hypothetical protein